MENIQNLKLWIWGWQTFFKGLSPSGPIPHQDFFRDAQTVVLYLDSSSSRQGKDLK